MDSLSHRAIEDYHRMLEDDAAVRREVEERFLERLAAAQLTFGGRALCSFPRPNLISHEAYERVRGVCRGIFAAVERVERELGEALWDLVELTDAERELMAFEPGYARSSPLSRMDSFLTTSAFQFVELNAETPAGAGYNDVLSEVFLELEPMRRFSERWEVQAFHVRQKILDTLVRCYREAGGTRERPTIAVVDYEEVPTRTEHHLFRAFFESQGYPSLVCDPRHMEYLGGELRAYGQRVDVIYKRLLVNELLERRDQLGPLMEALRDGAVVLVNPLRCKPIHKKAIFAVLTDDAVLDRLAPEERSAIQRHVPWTRRVVESRTTCDGKPVDLIPFIRAERHTLAIKPNDEYGGKGVFLGWELDESGWDAAIQQALAGSYVVQRRVELQRQRFPRLVPELEFADLVVDLDPFLFDGEVEGFLTRLSGTSLANVSSGGGAGAVLPGAAPVTSRPAAALLALLAAACGDPAPPAPSPEAIARDTGLAAGEGVDLVATNCLACHSFRLVAQNRGDAEDWTATIRWLQESQGLWELDPAEEATIVTYLSTHYPRERRFSRRAPLAEALMPPLPGGGDGDRP